MLKSDGVQFSKTNTFAPCLDQMLSVNQIARFFKIEYLKNGLSASYNFLFDDLALLKEHNDGINDNSGVPMAPPQDAKRVKKKGPNWAQIEGFWTFMEVES